MTVFSKMARTLRLMSLTVAMGLSCGALHAHVEELADDDLSQVSGEDGVSISLHLEWNANALTAIDLSDLSTISVGFKDATSGANSYFMFHGVGGIVDIWDLHIDARSGPAGVGDYVDITLPSYVYFKQFGVRAVSAQSDPNVLPKASYGQWLLNGSALVTGNVFIWPAK